MIPVVTPPHGIIPPRGLILPPEFERDAFEFARASVGPRAARRRAGGASLPARYWRIKWTAAQDAGVVAAIAHVEMYSGVFGGAQLCSGGATIGSFDDVGFPQANAFDADITNFWADNSQAAITDCWLGYDFGAGNNKEIKTILMQARGDAAFIGQSPASFDLEYSNDLASWAVYGSASGLTWDTSEIKLFRLTSPTWTSYGAKRYWRIFFHKRVGFNPANEPFGCTELELMTSVGGSDVTTSGMTYISSGDLGGFPVSNIGDNNTGTFWTRGAGLATGQYAGVDLGVGNAQDILEFTFTVRPDAFREDPASMRIQASDDNTTWETVYVPPLQTTWTAGEKRTFTLA